MLIGLSGYARSGKDTIAEILCLNYGFKRVSFALPIRDGIYTLNPLVENNIRVNNEFYVCQVYNQAIQDDKTIRIKQAKTMWGLGTPEDLDYFIKNEGVL